MMQFSIPYQQTSFEPMLGAPTARANFCEEDYIVTGGIAEFINTLTNFVYSAPYVFSRNLFGTRLLTMSEVVYAVQHLSHVQPKNATSVVKMPYYGLALVGVCSALFHGTLKYSAQMSDDISMLVASACVLYRSVTFDRTRRQTVAFTALLTLALTGVTAYHVVEDEQLVHEMSFVLIILAVGLRTRSLIQTRLKHDEQRIKYRHDTFFGAACFALGYLLWQLDFRYCSELTKYKRQIGMPWSFALEFHGYWHVLTAVGACTFMTMIEDLTQEEFKISGTKTQ